MRNARKFLILSQRNVYDKKTMSYTYKKLIIIIIMWKLKCTIVPVIIGATGIVTRSLTL